MDSFILQIKVKHLLAAEFNSRQLRYITRCAIENAMDEQIFQPDGEMLVEAIKSIYIKRRISNTTILKSRQTDIYTHEQYTHHMFISDRSKAYELTDPNGIIREIELIPITKEDYSPITRRQVIGNKKINLVSAE